MLDNMFLFELTDQIIYGLCWVKVYFLSCSLRYLIRCLSDLCWRTLQTKVRIIYILKVSSAPYSYFFV